MAAEAEVPLLPVIIWGSQRVWTKDHPRRLGRTRTPVTIAVGPAVPTDGEPAAITGRLRERMTTLLHEVQAAYPDGEPGAWWQPARLGGTAPTPERALQLDQAEATARAERRAAKDQDKRR
jgi:1-acyl-sn-glycerol-3-phosphate acyltransferase